MVAMPPDAVSLADLARERGVSGQAIRKRVSKLEDDGVLVSYRSPSGAKFVSKAAFDFAVGVTGDPAKEAAAESSAALRGVDRPRSAPSAERPAETSRQPAVPVDETPAYRDAKARDAHYAAELKRLAFERDDGKLYRVEEVEAALIRISGAVREVAKGLVARADEGAEALEGGMPVFRRWLIQVGDDLCRSLAAQWRVIAEEGHEPAPSDPDRTAADEEE